MAVLSKIIVLGALAASSLFVSPVAAHLDNNHGRAVARHLKHPQARAHHPVAASPESRRAGSKRASKKNGRCAAKSSSTTSAASSTITTTSSTSTSHSKTKTKTKTTSTKTSTDSKDTGKSDSGSSSGGSSSGGSGGGKAGLCWNDATNYDLTMFGSKMDWYYTWSPYPGCKKDKDCPDFCPMFWSPKQKDAWNDNVMGKHWKCVLGQNEPDQDGQANISPEEAAAQWKQYIEPVNADVKVSPAVTSDHGAWLKRFLAACDTCQVDACAVHDYGTNAAAFKSRISSFQDICGDRPIWVTEWSAYDYSGNNKQLDQDGVNAYLAETQGWLESQSWVHKYAYFAPNTKLPSPFNSANRLLSSGGQVTDLGWQYAGNA